MNVPKQLGRYEITEILGRGAMGVVYKAHDPLIDRDVAIKTISYAGLTPDEAKDFEQRFFLEAKSAGRLNQPNIVTVHDVGHTDELAYIAMEFLVGQSLREILDSGVVLPASRMARYAYSVADGLAFAHANGVIHRDIKPGNIMVLESGRVKITDFGIALLPSGSLTTAGMAVGSPKYMSPEQVLGQKADARSDIFSLGAVLYEMLTGTPPFAGDDLNAILYQVLNGAPPLPSTINAGLPPGFDRIVARALAKDPDKRYQSAAEMATDLRNYQKLRGLLQTGHASAEESSPTAKVAARAGKSAKPAAASGKRLLNLGWGIALASLALVLGGTYLWRSQTHAPLVASATASPASTQTIEHATPPAPRPVPAEKLAEATPPPVQQSDNTKASPAPAQKLSVATKHKKSKPSEWESDKQIAAPTAAPAAKDEKQATHDWKAQLRAELADCKPKSFFSRISCNESARWKYCPGHWGTIEECPQTASNQ
ncbi:MAG TPA: protein kinase [Rhodocyclaceae bacterium]|nr:protein kinase [Rhodocyclaceae bacterium]